MRFYFEIMADNTTNTVLSLANDVKHLKDNLTVSRQNKNNSTTTTTTPTSINDSNNVIGQRVMSIDTCTDQMGCFSIMDILKLFNAAVSEEQAWALIYQSVYLYKDAFRQSKLNYNNFVLPKSAENLHVHKDGTMHASLDKNGMYNNLFLFKKFSLYENYCT